MVENKKSGADFPQDSTESKNQLDLSEKNSKSESSKREERVLRFWQENNFFKKTLEKKSPKGEFTFYDGPPFATGTPHYGHILAGTIKDIIPRYKTMQGYHVDRKWGWDCHGLPIENLIQKENNLNTKKDIESFGVKKFNQCAKASVFRYDAEWKKIVPKTGRFVDMENSYTTMDNNFMESVWWGFKELYKKGLVYENFRSMHISPLLETPLSNFEVNQEYKDITDISAFVRFEILDENQQEKVSLIAWTTTPWTLFSNVALAVGGDIEYAKIKLENVENNNLQINSEIIIIAKSRIENVLKDKKYEILETFPGVKLVGKKYIPVFDHYYKNKDLENYENGWKVYSADFVTTEDGTGIVHIAPAFGEDDLILGQKENLPFVQHVNIDGTIKSEITELAGRAVKPKATDENSNKHQETDIEVIKLLAHSGKLFAKEKYTHSYPHCWRTHAPLLNYALSSWFIKVTDYKDKMVELNKKVKWVPENVGSKRFGNWLENAKDWGISRSRFWGTPIPIWKSEDGLDVEVLGSVAEIKKWTKSKNKYYLMRHGEADHNINNFLSSDNSVSANLTEKGKKQIENNAKKLANKKIDYIFVSPLNRTRQTADIVSSIIGFDNKKIIIDDRLKEVQGGELNGSSVFEYKKLFKNNLDKFSIAPKNGETLADIRKRIGDFIYEIDSKYEGKNIIIITHEYPIWMFMSVKDGLDNLASASIKNPNKDFVEVGHFEEYDFSKLPHDDDYILDLHRPYIDEIVFEKNGKEMKRIPDIFDGWVDSGSMPFATLHYPFENKDKIKKAFSFKKGIFPADFIAEGLDQTRGWFYTLLAINTPLFGKSPYKNVIVNGLVLAEDGQKMSKSLKNYEDPEIIINTYGADAMRYYMISSPIVQAEPLNFSEKGVDEVMKKIIGRLMNVVSFYQLYVDKEKENKIENPKSENILDKWIIARLQEVLSETTNAIENYELDKSCRPFFDFVDDLSTWYLRRSRDRIKGDDLQDKKFAIETLGYVLYEFAKIIAPFMPFVAEEMYQTLTGFNFYKKDKSIHLENWSLPEKTKIKIDKNVLKDMESVREIVTRALQKRDEVEIRVRQPLSKLVISDKTEISQKLNDQYKKIISEEVNVKEVLNYSDELKNKIKDLPSSDEIAKELVWLDTEITNELKEEGNARELIRFIQSMRKDKNLKQEDKIDLEISENSKRLIQRFEMEIRKITNINEINFISDAGSDFSELKIEKDIFRLKIKIV